MAFQTERFQADTDVRTPSCTSSELLLLLLLLTHHHLLQILDVRDSLRHGRRDPGLIHKSDSMC